MQPVKRSVPKAWLNATVEAARAAGALLRENAQASKVVQLATQHDIKLELDVRCQEVIQSRLLRALPGSAVLGEEGVAGDPCAPVRWVVDPIDGTVNFSYGIPHACVSIALEERGAPASGGWPQGRSMTVKRAPVEFGAVMGVVYDPFCDELWTAVAGDVARLNGRPICVSKRRRLAETIVSVGFGKSTGPLEYMLPVFVALVPRVRKVRMTGSAALDLAYVASGRFDAYIETGVRLWDIAAAGFILDRAGGGFDHRAVAGEHTYEVVATNGYLRPELRQCMAGAVARPGARSKRPRPRA